MLPNRHRINLKFETTLSTLERGSRLVEILKQKQFAPLLVEQQVILAYERLMQQIILKMNFKTAKLI
jgi:F0F1-type ATP synthase alpha subunit